MTTITIEQVKNELELVRVILLGYPSSMARDDALRATEVISRSLAAPATAPAQPEWPTMPPRKNQSHILFKDGYDEGWAKYLEAYKAIFATPATAPVPAWHDAPTVPGLWVCRQAITDNVQAYEVTDQMALNRNLKLKGQWYGPIPEDKQ